MNRNKENDILETTLSIAEHEYSEAYRFLLNAYEESPGSFGPQTFYFLACLAGGANMPELALTWLRKAIQEHNMLLEQFMKMAWLQGWICKKPSSGMGEPQKTETQMQNVTLVIAISLEKVFR